MKDYSTISDLSTQEIEIVNGAGLFDWISEWTRGFRINIFGIEISDGIPNSQQ